MKLLLIDGDADHGSVLSKSLGSAGYCVDWKIRGREGQEAALAGGYGLMVLDARLPDMDGLDICRALVRSGEAPGMLLLSSCADVGQRVRGLDAGADDYLVKPFALEELLARLRALLRRRLAPAGASEACLSVGDLVLDRQTREARSGQQQVELTLREFHLLEFLMRNAGKPLSRENILTYVWDEPVSMNSVDVYMGYVRRKLGVLRSATRVETIRSVGFRLAPVPSPGRGEQHLALPVLAFDA
ncbi:response regulator transcription factor [Xanthobacter autotrophicus]|uniref:response regulator transcription factor n=1 Tax=Xanthobacter TaxID=279 RepID=UPI0024AB346B|nr:response regulator transcription factor [Xanthobacter autotrophicus]MDI4664269.1 response regulator transcription factor [Xanthobacter autotrophicus]